LGDYISLNDNTIPDQPIDSAWETCMTMNKTWGYSKYDHNYKSVTLLLQHLVTIVSKGGNFLLNVGPDGKGLFPTESQKILKDIGSWISINKTAIYETQPCPFLYSHETWQCTAKPGKLFFHVLKWPGTALQISGIKVPVADARFLANSKKVPFKQEGDQVTFALPLQPVDPYITVIAVKLKYSLGKGNNH
jgi:alpha-L-fucosidase